MVIELKDRYEEEDIHVSGTRTGSSGACFHRDKQEFVSNKYLVLYLLSSVDCDPQSPNVGWCLFLGRWNKKGIQ